MVTIGCFFNLPVVQRRKLSCTHHYAGQDLGQIVPARTETPIEKLASLWVTSKFKILSESQHCESYGGSCVCL